MSFVILPNEMIAPSSYPALSPEDKARICNGCGGKGMIDLVPDCILGADVEEACNIHDYEYHLGLDKRGADRRFLHNLMALCRCENPLKYVARCKVCLTYFDAVSAVGGAFFGKD